MSAEPLEPGPGEPVIAWDPSRLRQVKVSDLAVRFGFGAAVSVAAAVTGSVFGAFVGGMFLAFPAILPATLTLLEQHDGSPAAVHDQRGALLGALGMVAFALAAALGFDRLAVGAVAALASVAWTLVAVGVYLAVASWRRDHRPAAPSA